MLARQLIVSGIAVSGIALGIAGCAVQPEPLSELGMADYASDKRARVVAHQEPLTKPLTLSEAMARALKYNLDKEVEVMNILLAEQQLRVAHYSLLPGAVANSGYADRNNYSGGSSVRLTSPTTIGEESLTSSSSSDRNVRTSDIRFSWHVLDFGLSYIRAKQSADKVLIAEETRRRVIVRMLENVRTAYWRAVAATRLLQKLDLLETRVDRALKETRTLAVQGDSTPLTALTFERELVEIRREIRKLTGELSSAKIQLAALINHDPGKPLHVAVPGRLPPPAVAAMKPNEMVDVALSHRSELREVAYQQRITARDAEAALLEMLPGLTLDAQTSWNSNQFLYNSNWVSWGAQASWNLIKVFSYPERRAEVDAKDALLNARALAVTMAIMTQVHVSRARLYHGRREFQVAHHHYDVQNRILDQIRSALAVGKVSEQTAIREEMNALVATVKRDLAYAELQSAASAVVASMGQTPFEALDTTAMSIADLRSAMASSTKTPGL